MSAYSVSLGTLASGGMLFQGGGVTTLTGINTYTGGTTVTAGTLTLGAGGGSGAIRGPLNINSGTTVNLTAGDALGFNVGTSVTTVSISGGRINNSTASNNSYITNYSLTGGTISSSGGGNYNFSTGNGVTTKASNLTSVISGPIIIRDANNLTFNVASGTTPTGIDLLVSGSIAGTGTLNSVTKTGAPGETWWDWLSLRYLHWQHDSREWFAAPQFRHAPGHGGRFRLRRSGLRRQRQRGLGDHRRRRHAPRRIQ